MGVRSCVGESYRGSVLCGVRGFGGSAPFVPVFRLDLDLALAWAPSPSAPFRLFPLTLGYPSPSALRSPLSALSHIMPPHATSQNPFQI